MKPILEEKSSTRTGGPLYDGFQLKIRLFYFKRELLKVTSKNCFG